MEECGIFYSGFIDNELKRISFSRVKTSIKVLN